MEQNVSTYSISQQDNYFCYLYVHYYQITYLGYAEIALGLILLFFTYRHYRNLSKVAGIPRNLKFVYTSIFAQILLQIAQMGFGLVIYWLYHNMQSLDPVEFTYFSKIVFIFDVVEIFFMEGLIILVCYNWMERVIILLQKLAELETQYGQEQQSGTQNILKLEIISRKIIGFYLILRTILFIILIAQVVIKNNGTSFYRPKTVFIVVLVQIFIAMVLLLISIYAISKKNRITEIVQKSQIKKLRNQYLILLICCLIKFAAGLFVQLTLDQQHYHEGCSLDPQFITFEDKVFLLVLYSLLFIFNYYLPTCFILRIFDLKPDYDVSESLLITDPIGSSAYEDFIKSN